MNTDHGITVLTRLSSFEFSDTLQLIKKVHVTSTCFTMLSKYLYAPYFTIISNPTHMLAILCKVCKTVVKKYIWISST